MPLAPEHWSRERRVRAYANMALDVLLVLTGIASLIVAAFNWHQPWAPWLMTVGASLLLGVAGAYIQAYRRLRRDRRAGQ